RLLSASMLVRDMYKRIRLTRMKRDTSRYSFLYSAFGSKSEERKHVFQREHSTFPCMARTGDSKITMIIGQWIRAGLEDSPKKNTIPILDGVRGFACLIVIWFHI